MGVLLTEIFLSQNDVLYNMSLLKLYKHCLGKNMNVEIPSFHFHLDGG